ncbi:Acetyl-coenzyme A carboxyl transferase beta chain, partial [hydrothermal vent metagenome]
MTQTQARTQTKPATERRSSIPEGLWLRCPGCGQMVYRRQMEANLHVCPECSHHYRIGAVERVKQLADTGSFAPMFTNIESRDPLGFKDLKKYPDRLLAEKLKTGQTDAVQAGMAFIKGRQAMLCCLDLTFMMGSMGS